MNYDKAVRSLSVFGSVVCLFFVFDAVFQFGDCFDCSVVHANFGIHPVVMACLGIVVFSYYFASTTVESLRKHLHIVSLHVLAAEAVLLAVQSIFSTYCVPCVVVSIVFCILLLVVHRSQMSKIVIGISLSLLIGGMLHLTQFKNVGQSSPFLSSMIVKNTEESRYLVIQSSCKHCEELVEQLDKSQLLKSLNVLSIDKPTQLHSSNKTVKDRLYASADWSDYANHGLVNFLAAFGLKSTPILIESPDSNTIQMHYGTTEILEHLNTIDKQAN